MKKIILISTLISGLLVPTFSQMNSHLKTDTTFRNFSGYRYQQPFSLANSGDFKNQLNGKLNDKNYFSYRLSSKNLKVDQGTINTIEEKELNDNMPCIKPQGFFPMRVYKPDSTVKYTMRIGK